MQTIKKINIALDNGLAKAVFDHVRNYMMCSLLLAIGVSGFGDDSDLLLNLIPNTYSTISLVALSFILFCLNLYDGIRVLSKSSYHTIYIIGLVVIYIAMSVVVIELTSSFRASFTG
ncbi:MAG: hypothetical protein OEM38_06955 [Gammaproteobacteria bacterium]|nr:hypothetical protein [Gammaproteobacteria bacterium]